MKSITLEIAARQALEAIGDCPPNKALVKAAYALREALVHSGEADEMVEFFSKEMKNKISVARAEQAEQEPVALNIGLEKEVLALKHNVVGSHDYTQGRWDLLGEVQDVIRKHAFPVIDTCDFGHKFAKLSDHPKKDGKARCPHCLASGLDAARALEQSVRTKDPTDDEIVDVMNKIYGSMWTEQDRDFARTIIQKFKEKNNANNNT